MNQRGSPFLFLLSAKLRGLQGNQMQRNWSTPSRASIFLLVTVSLYAIPTTTQGNSKHNSSDLLPVIGANIQSVGR